MKPKILFCNSTCNSLQQEISENLISILHTMPIEIDLLRSDLDLHYVRYNLAIAYNKQGYNNFKKLGLNIPLLYVIPSDAYCDSMLFDFSAYAHLLILNTKGIVYSNSFVTQFSFLFGVNKIASIINERQYRKLLVDIGNTNVLMGLLPLLNIYVDYEINILTPNPYRLKDIINAHIKLSTEKNRGRLIEEADVLIAEGHTALKGVMQQKPVLVLGEYGFGGLVERDNVKEQYRTGFAGRLGGVKGEYLPLPMIDFEIKKVLDCQVNGLKETADALNECCQEAADKLLKSVSFFANLSQQKEKVFLQKNHYMDYIYNNEGCYWVVDKVYRKFLFEIDEKEKCIVDYFETPQKLSLVYEEMKDNMLHEEIEKSVNELLKYKLLDYCIYETTGTEF